MERVHVYADESGNFDFSRSRGASRFFILTTVTLGDWAALSNALTALRHEIAWEGFEHPGPFHANADPHPVRQRVFDAIRSHPFRVDSILLEKSKAQPRLTRQETLFYRYSWFYLMKFLLPQIVPSKNDLLVVASSIGAKRKRRAFSAAVQEVMTQLAGGCRTACWDAASEACLQVADYCGWAVQRKWEHGDDRPWKLIESRIQSEYDLFQAGSTHYY